MNRREFFMASAMSGSAAVAARGTKGRVASPRATQAAVVARDGTRLRVRDWGQGRPMVLLTGWGLSADFWDHDIADLIAQGTRCIAFDRRGHGRSDEPGHGYDYDTLADDLAAVLETLDLRQIVIVGYSMAGGEVIRYLTRHGAGRIAHLVLVSALTPGLARSPSNPSGVPPEALALSREKIAQDYPRWIAENEAPFWTADTSAEMKTWAKGLMLRASLPALLACHRTMLETDFRTECRALRVPTSIIHGDKDASAPFALTGAVTAQLIAKARLLVYEGAPHGLPITHRSRFVRDLLEVRTRS